MIMVTKHIVIDYNRADVEATRQCYLMMHGRMSA